MTPSGTRSNGRGVWRALIVCLALGMIVFVMLKLYSTPRAQIVAVPVTGREVATPNRPGSAPTERASVPPAELEVTTLSSTPPSAIDKKSATVHGTVRGRNVGPVANAHVSFELERGTETEAVGQATTDAEGEYAFSSAELAAQYGTQAKLRVDVQAAGFQPGSVLYDLRTCSPKVGLQVDVTVTSGALVVGRVVDVDQAPVHGAVITLLVANKSGSVTTFSPVGTARGGEFSLGFASSAEYRLSVRAEDVGTAIVEKLELEAGVDKQLDDIVLTGGAPIWGRVVAPGGEPAADLELWAIDGSYANEVDALARATMRIAADERGDGLSLTKTWTDPQGNFLLKGLRPGHYALRSPDRQLVLEPRQLRYEPGTKNVELVVQSQRLIVRVMNAGRPVPRGRHESKSPHPARGAGVRITDLATLPDGSYQVSNTRSQGVNKNTGIASFTLDPEAPVAVQAFDGKRVSPEEIVILAQNEWTRDLTLTLGDMRDAGRVRFDVFGDDGLPLTHLRIAALSSVTKIARDELGELETDDNGILAALTAGSYHFVIGYAPGTDRDHFVVRTTEPVVVRANEETVVSLRARRGGRVRIALDLRGSPPNGYTKSNKLSSDERRDRFGARVTLTPTAGGTATALHFRSGAGPGLVSAILPGETFVSDVLVERGTYDVAIESSAFTLASPLRTVVEAGATPEFVITVVAR